MHEIAAGKIAQVGMSARCSANTWSGAIKDREVLSELF